MRLQNLDPNYTPQEFAAKRDSNGKWSLDIDQSQLRWESYVKAGYYVRTRRSCFIGLGADKDPRQGVLDHYFADTTDEPVGFDALFVGTVPGGSGLSSSAAMVVASTITFLLINGKLANVTRGKLVEIAMENERRVGVNSGGMDQAASAIPPSHPTSALYISFYPKLHAEPIALPPGADLVIAHSMFTAEKHLTSKTNYNLRVVETLAAARVLARRLGVEVAKGERVTLREVLDRWLGVTNPSAEAIQAGLERILSHVDGLKLQDAPSAASDDPDADPGHTLDEMVEVSGLDSSTFHELYMNRFEVEATHFQLYRRAKHVFTEALRVLQFRALCLKAAKDGATDAKETLLRLGTLFNESQTSCRDLFNCSAEGLDELTGLARAEGAYGSRLTGAGWGGCTVSLVPKEKVEGFIKALREQYKAYKDMDDDTFGQYVFATKPGAGASGECPEIILWSVTKADAAVRRSIRRQAVSIVWLRLDATSFLSFPPYGSFTRRVEEKFLISTILPSL